MLVLTRKTGEEIVIGDDVRVRITEIRTSRVCLGIIAPTSVSVERAEVHDKRMEGKLLEDRKPGSEGADSSPPDGEKE